MNRLSTVFFVILCTQLIQVQADDVCIAPQVAMTPVQALHALKELVATKPLTEHDKEMIRTIVGARLEGRMLKVAPNFSDNGNEVYMHVITQSECLGGFETLQGAVYGIDLMQLMQ